MKWASTATQNGNTPKVSEPSPDGTYIPPMYVQPYPNPKLPTPISSARRHATGSRNAARALHHASGTSTSDARKNRSATPSSGGIPASSPTLIPSHVEPQIKHSST